MPLQASRAARWVTPTTIPLQRKFSAGTVETFVCAAHASTRRPVVPNELRIPKRQQAREFSHQVPHTFCHHNIGTMLPLEPLPSMPHSSKARKKNPVGLRRRPAPSVNSVRSSIGSICRLRPCFVTLKTSEDAEPTTTPDSKQQVIQSGHDTPLKQGQSLVIGICGSVYVWVPACAMMCSCGVHIRRGPDSPSDPL